MLQTLGVQVLELYRKVDQDVAAYRKSSGLACPGGCVKCCYSEKVEATVLEMMPAAFNLFRTGQAELILKRLERHDNSKQCILFRPDLSQPDGGGCTHYPYRALVCRLFGFAGNSDRNGIPQLARCRNMPVTPKTQESRQPASEPARAIPLFHAYGIAVTTIHPNLGTLRKPINEALYEALVKVGLILDLGIVSTAVIELDLPPDAPATRPSRPCRKAA